MQAIPSVRPGNPDKIVVNESHRIEYAPTEQRWMPNRYEQANRRPQAVIASKSVPPPTPMVRVNSSPRAIAEPVAGMVKKLLLSNGHRCAARFGRVLMNDSTARRA